ncbi:Rho GTPase-activating protein [Tieghemiomyces parasiticus]|uniref:Rho GTPase-activating protein n=1 Tax=Tieghemiomyces parasiticus TaxID=78921 RepID=A0A9W7ZR15_9FUNG|nr:Rho GTPase-activating protein [Tieghemiomyces parasiticus]
MPEPNHLPRIDVGDSTPSEFSTALYSELASRTGVDTYPAADGTGKAATKTALRPNPHRLQSSRSRHSLKQTPYGPTSPLPPPLKSIPASPLPPLQPLRYSPLASPVPVESPAAATRDFHDNLSRPGSGGQATPANGTAYLSPAHRAAASSDQLVSGPSAGLTSLPPSPPTRPSPSKTSGEAKHPEFHRRYKFTTSTSSTGSLRTAEAARGDSPGAKSQESRTDTLVGLGAASGADLLALPVAAEPGTSPRPRSPVRTHPTGILGAPLLKSASLSLDDTLPDHSDTSSAADSDARPLRGSASTHTAAERHDSFALLLERVRQTLNSTKDTVTFLRRRALIEETYSQGMLKLTQDMAKNQLKEDVRSGTYRDAWGHLIDLHEAVALNHLRLTTTLTDMADELTSQYREKERLRRHLKDSSQKHKKALADAEKHLDKFREKYDHCSEDLEKAILKKKAANDTGVRKNRSKSVSNTVAMILGRDSSVADLERAEKEARYKVENSSDAYRSQLSSTNAARHDYFSVLLPSMLTALKSVAEEGDLCLSLHLGKYARAYETLLAADATVIAPINRPPGPRGGLLSVVETIDNEGDLTDYLTRTPPAPVSRRKERFERVSNLSHEFPSFGALKATENANSPAAGVLSQSTQAHLNANLGATRSLTNPPPRPTSSTFPPAGLQLPHPAGLEAQTGRDQSPVPFIVLTCTAFIEKHGIKSEGIYRLSGQNSVVKQLKEELDTTGKVAQFERLDASFDVNNVSSFLKLYFRELPNGLVPVELYDALAKAVEARDPTMRLQLMQQALATLPKPNYSTLRHMILHLYRIQECQKVNMMNISNLAIVFGPTLIRAPDTANPISSMQMQCKVVEQILESCHDLFQPFTSNDLSTLG